MRLRALTLAVCVRHPAAQTDQPVTYTGRITTVDPAAAGHRDQHDPYTVEPVAVVDGTWAESHGHATPDHAETWARRLLQRASTPERTALRWAVTRSEPQAGTRPDDRAGQRGPRSPR